MSNRIESPWQRLVAMLSLMAVLAGCGGGQTSVESFHPQADFAEEALTAALTAWQEGETQESLVETLDPPVQFQDDAWNAGSKLKSFEIVESSADANPRKFLVKLMLEGVATPEQITYVVVGKSPLHILREKEYNRDSAM